jgi:hypothetical protein
MNLRECLASFLPGARAKEGNGESGSPSFTVHPTAVELSRIGATAGGRVSVVRDEHQQPPTGPEFGMYGKRAVG